VPGETPRVIQPSSGDRSTGLADGVEQQQRRCGRPDTGGGVHKFLGLLKRRHKHGRSLVIIRDTRRGARS
jgi:hypothetical protein